MGPIAAIDLPPTISHHQFGLGLVTIVFLRLVTVGDDLPWLIRQQRMIVILRNMYCSKKENVFSYMCACSIIVRYIKKRKY